MMFQHAAARRRLGPLWNPLLLKAWGSLFRQGIAKEANGEYGTLLFTILDFHN